MSYPGAECYARAMLDLRLVSENLDLVREQLARRGFSDSEALDRLGKLTEEQILEDLKALGYFEEPAAE